MKETQRDVGFIYAQMRAKGRVTDEEAKQLAEATGKTVDEARRLLSEALES